jgi:Na+-translocating ferredoxin:NAD+ oxidoreductase RnfA subunit
MERSWKWRRSIVFLIVCACILLLFAGMAIGGADPVRQSIVTGAFMTLIAVSGAYLGVAMLDDRNKASELLAGIAQNVAPAEGKG